MNEIERDLRILATRIDYPPAPQIAAAAVAQIRRDGPRRAPRITWRAVALAAAVVVVAFALALVASPSVRHAVADFIGVDGARISFDNPPSPTGQIGEHLAIGKPSTIDRVEQKTSFPVGVPSVLGDPDAVYFDSLVSGGAVWLVYEPRDDLPASGNTGVGALITEFQARFDREIVQKYADMGTVVRRTTVAGEDAFFLSGRPHLLYIDRDGNTLEDDPRLVGNVLIWEAGNVTYRLEADVGLRRAVAIASSIRD
ncbi:MAG TPA: hypothetical protein VFK89_01910 [Actinomycetota bacterium]|nr:hypothetical protein [Actinomycetota bacterium]